VPLFRCLVEREDGLNRASRHTGAAVDAFVRVNIQHFRRLKRLFVLARMDAVDWADVNARRILGTDARFTNDVRHALLLGSSTVQYSAPVEAFHDRRGTRGGPWLHGS